MTVVSRLMKNFKNLFVAAFGCMAILATNAAAEATPTGEPLLGGFLKETRIIYPLQLGEWAAQGEHLYENQEYGVSIRYASKRHKDRWIDMYFYPGGALTEKEFATIAEQTAEEPRLAAEQRGELQGFEMDKLSEFTLHIPSSSEKGKSEAIDARSVSMRLPRQGKMYSSALVITANRLYLIKGRYSVEHGKVSDASVKRTLERFLADLVRATTIVSAGNCGLPLPIVQKPAPLISTDDSLMSADVEGRGLEAIAYPDRVEALDPASPNAILLQHLATSATGRMAAGCVPQEDINLQVTEGMREIRIEYRLPGT